MSDPPTLVWSRRRDLWFWTPVVVTVAVWVVGLVLVAVLVLLAPVLEAVGCLATATAARRRVAPGRHYTRRGSVHEYDGKTAPTGSIKAVAL